MIKEGEQAITRPPLLRAQHGVVFTQKPGGAIITRAVEEAIYVIDFHVRTKMELPKRIRIDRIQRAPFSSLVIANYYKVHKRVCDLVYQFNNQSDTMESILRSFSLKRLHKRAVLPFIGEAASWLFGTPSRKEMDRLKDALKTIQNSKGQDKQMIERNSKMILKFANQADSSFEEIFNRMEHLTNFYRWFTTKFEEYRDKVVDMTIAVRYIVRINILVSALQRKAEAIREMVLKRDQIISGLMDLERKVLTVGLIPYKDMSYFINEMRRHRNLRGKDVLFDPAVYYNFLVHTLYDEDEKRLYLSFKIPIISPVYYKIYTVKSFPIPVNDQGYSVSQITLPDEVYLIDRHNETTISMSLEEFNHCWHYHYVVCTGTYVREIVSETVGTMSCLSGLYFEHSRSVVDKCDVNLEIQERIKKKPEIITLSNCEILVVPHGHSLTYQCKGKLSKKLECIMCKIMFEHDCKLVLGGLSYKLQECRNSSVFRVEHTYSHAALHVMDIPDVRLNKSEFHGSILNVSLPDNPWKILQVPRLEHEKLTVGLESFKQELKRYKNAPFHWVNFKNSGNNDLIINVTIYFIIILLTIIIAIQARFLYRHQSMLVALNGAIFSGISGKQVNAYNDHDFNKEWAQKVTNIGLRSKEVEQASIPLPSVETIARLGMLVVITYYAIRYGKIGLKKVIRWLHRNIPCLKSCKPCTELVNYFVPRWNFEEKAEQHLIYELWIKIGNEKHQVPIPIAKIFHNPHNISVSQLPFVQIGRIRTNAISSTVVLIERTPFEYVYGKVRYQICLSSRREINKKAARKLQEMVEDESYLQDYMILSEHWISPIVVTYHPGMDYESMPIINIVNGDSLLREGTLQQWFA